MTDKIESELAEGIEHAMGGLRQADPGVDLYRRARDFAVQGHTVEQKLQEIERLVREIRAMSAQVKGLLG